MIQSISRFILRLIGWRIEGQLPTTKKYLIVGAPHTSNWDFVLAMLLKFGTGLQFNFIAKHTAFRWPLGVLFRWLGGIPIDRSKAGGLVEHCVALYSTRDSFVLGLAPEGTRSKASYWKTGFYHIAQQSQIPIAMGFVDYKRKRVGISDLYELSGDIEQDFAFIREFYSDKIARYPHDHDRIQLRPREQ